MTRSRTIAIAALSAGLLAGGGMGLTLGAASVTGATPLSVPTHRPGHDPVTTMSPPRHQGAGGPLATVASLLGTTVAEMKESWRAGTSIAAQAEAGGVPLATIIDALVAERSQRLSELVKRGRLTQAQADQRLAEASERMTAMLERSTASGPMHRHGHLGRMQR